MSMLCTCRLLYWVLLHTYCLCMECVDLAVGVLSEIVGKSQTSWDLKSASHVHTHTHTLCVVYDHRYGC